MGKIFFKKLVIPARKSWLHTVGLFFFLFCFNVSETAIRFGQFYEQMAF